MEILDLIDELIAISTDGAYDPDRAHPETEWVLRYMIANYQNPAIRAMAAEYSATFINKDTTNIE